MIKAYHFKYSKRKNIGIGNKVGGQPTLLPPYKPWPSMDDDLYGFVLQLEVDGLRLSVPDAVYIQLYQPIDEGFDPLPIPVLVPANASLNTQGVVLIHPLAIEWKIEFDEVEEPDSPPSEFSERIKYCGSKLGGYDPMQNDTNRRFLGRIVEDMADLNLAGMACAFYLTNDGKVIAEMQ